MRVLLLVLLALAAGAEEAPFVLVGATLVEPGRGPVADGAVVVAAGRIVASGPRATVAIPAGARIIDAAGAWITPGLIDAHIHFFQSGGLFTRPDAVDLRAVRPYADEIAGIRAGIDGTLRRHLRCGVTAVLDCGGPRWNTEVRARAQAAGAPVVAVMGPLIATWAPPELACDDPGIVQVGDVAAAEAMVAAQAAAGFDLIKIWYIVRPGETVAQHEPLVRRTIAAIHAHGLRAAVHATELETAKAALRAGADVLVHSVESAPVDDEFLDLCRRNRAVYIPTLMVERGYIGAFSQLVPVTPLELEWADAERLHSLFALRWLPAATIPEPLHPWLRAGRRARQEPALAARLLAGDGLATAQANLVRVHAAGITIAAGTDAGNIGTLHGPSLHSELTLMRAAGLTPAEVLACATRGGAAALGRADLGGLAPGMRADLLVLAADPLADPAHLARLRLVVAGGLVHDPATLVPDPPLARAQRLLAALSAGDLAIASAQADPSAVWTIARGQDGGTAAPVAAALAMLQRIGGADAGWRLDRAELEGATLRGRLVASHALGGETWSAEAVLAIGADGRFGAATFSAR